MRNTLLVVLVACGGSDPLPVFGPPTETVCPPSGTTLTYENFAAPFMERYCTRCHHEDLVGEARQGAPEFHDFNYYFGIVGVANHVDETSAAGPAVINRGMPQNGARPTDEERFLLGEWIACDMPE
jgi:hypothetical protein